MSGRLSAIRVEPWNVFLAFHPSLRDEVLFVIDGVEVGDVLQVERYNRAICYKDFIKEIY